MSTEEEIVNTGRRQAKARLGAKVNRLGGHTIGERTGGNVWQRTSGCEVQHD